MNYQSIDVYEPEVMNQNTNTYSDLPIVWDGNNDDREGNMLTLYKVQIDGAWTWFIGQEEYVNDGNDFKIAISSFGLWRKSSAGSTGEQFRRKFPASAERPLRERLTQFFLGPEEKPFFPFTEPKARLLSISFAHNWLLVD